MRIFDVGLRKNISRDIEIYSICDGNIVGLMKKSYFSVERIFFDIISTTNMKKRHTHDLNASIIVTRVVQNMKKKIARGTKEKNPH